MTQPNALATALSQMISVLDKAAAQAGHIFILKERCRRLKAIAEKMDESMFSLVYLNQNPQCHIDDKEMVFCIDPLTKFPVVVPLDLLKSSLNGMLILDYDTIKQYLMPNNDIRKTKNLLIGIVSYHESLIHMFETKNPGLLADMEKTMPADFQYPLDV